MIRFVGLLMLVIMISLYTGVDVQGQKKPVIADSSVLAGIRLPHEALLDKRLFFNAAAKTVLEMEASKHKISISDVEVYSFPEPTGTGGNAQALADAIVKSLKDSGYECQPSADDPSYIWLGAGNKKIIMYLMANKRETSLYFGKADNLPPYFNTPLSSGALSPEKDIGSNNITNSTITSGTSNTEAIAPASAFISDEAKKLLGNWGNLSGSKVNYQDGSTGYMVVSGQSRGFGLELRPDGSYLQTSVVTSGRPSYRIFVSTSGKWTTKGNQMIFFPQDRHYRKWENEIISTDEHSVPEQYIMIWDMRRNDITGKECLYIKYTVNQPQWEELCRE